jgi:hypothetical protein
MKQERCSFLKKRTKKLLSVWLGSPQCRRVDESFFASFFTKKEVLSSFLGA